LEQNLSAELDPWTSLRSITCCPVSFNFFYLKFEFFIFWK
jgi:hypothetical protein